MVKIGTEYFPLKVRATPLGFVVPTFTWHPGLREFSQTLEFASPWAGIGSPLSGLLESTPLYGRYKRTYAENNYSPLNVASQDSSYCRQCRHRYGFVWYDESNGLGLCQGQKRGLKARPFVGEERHSKIQTLHRVTRPDSFTALPVDRHHRRCEWPQGSLPR